MSQPEEFVVRLREGLADTNAVVAVGEQDLFRISDPSAMSGRLISVLMRTSSDFDVAVHIPNRGGSPFEQVFVGPSAESGEIQAAVVHFVADFVSERVLVGAEKGIFKASRRFIAASELDSAMRKRFKWVASWRGRFDSERTAA